jgi:DtxR family Mn-dependent transcriptional regulator
MPSKSSLDTSTAVQDFLKAVYMLQQRSENNRVSTNALAEALDILPPSVTDMARRLSEGGLVDYKKYHGVHLTENGEEIALRILRRHRLVELYLMQELGYPLHEVHEDAEQLEHAVSERFIEAISKKMGHPEFDPHGDPIPSVDGVITRRNLIPLCELEFNQEAIIARFMMTQADMLQYLLERGIVLNETIQVKSIEPFEGPLTILVDSQQQIIGYNVAKSILVEVASDE